MQDVKIEYLCDHPHIILELEKHFKIAWSDYYGPDGVADPLKDIMTLCNKSSLPIGLIALKGKTFCGSVALRRKSASHESLGPWLTSLFVLPELRRAGIGKMLVSAVENLSQKMGYFTIYSRSATAKSLFMKNNWIAIDDVYYGGHYLSVFKKDII